MLMLRLPWLAKLRTCRGETFSTDVSERLDDDVYDGMYSTSMNTKNAQPLPKEIPGLLISRSGERKNTEENR